MVLIIVEVRENLILKIILGHIISLLMIEKMKLCKFQFSIEKHLSTIRQFIKY